MKNDSKGKLILKIYSYGQRNFSRDTLWEKINWKIYKLLNAIFVIGLFNTEIPASNSISNKIIFFHPYGIVINPYSHIKKNVIIRQQVTIGNKGNKETEMECPIIEENVEIGAGAKIIGPVHIGKNSKIGVNAVVTKSFPPNSIIVGIPGKNIAQRKD